MRITALDLGASTGVCYGEPGSEPHFETWNLRADDLGQRCFNLMRHLHTHLRNYSPNAFWIEAPMNIAPMMDRGARAETVLSLYGYNGVVLAVVASVGLEGKLVNVQTARQHFLGLRPKGGEGKKRVMQRCEMLGWRPGNGNESDAGAVWAYACAKEAPGSWIKHQLAASARLG